MKTKIFMDILNNSFLYNTESQFFINSNNTSLDLGNEIKTPKKKQIKIKKFNSHIKIWNNSKLNNSKSRKSFNLNNISQKENKNKWFEDIILKVQNQFLPQLSKIQDDYIKELDNIYIENFNKIEEINYKYNSDNNEYNNESENNLNEQNENNEIINIKNDLFEEVESEFIIKKNSTLLKYNENISQLKECIKKEINKLANEIKEELIILHCNDNNDKNINKRGSCKNFNKKKKI